MLTHPTYLLFLKVKCQYIKIKNLQYEVIYKNRIPDNYIS